MAPTRTSINRFLTLMRGTYCTGDHLDLVDSAHPIIAEVFTNGNCGNLALILADVFQGGVFVDETTVHACMGVKIDGIITYWDISGEIHPSSPKQVNECELIDMGYVDNYSFDERGTLV